VLLYYISDRKSFAGTEEQQRNALLRRIAQAASAGVDYIQLREKDLSPRELERLAREAVRAVRNNSTTAKLLINSRADVALACGADGVHLPAGDLAASEVRALWVQSSDQEPLIGVSGHNTADIRCAETQGANFAVLAPIFEKAQTDAQGIGLDALREACLGSPLPNRTQAAQQGRFAVLALGGVTLANAAACIAAGAAGVAGIRLFQQGDVSDTVHRLRAVGNRAGQLASSI